MADGNPYPPPAPLVLSNMLAQAAWRPDLDDQLRLLLEWASDTIRGCEIERGRAMSRAEHKEAEAETYAKLLYGPNQKGGAA